MRVVNCPASLDGTYNKFYNKHFFIFTGKICQSEDGIGIDIVSPTAGVEFIAVVDVTTSCPSESYMEAASQSA